MKKKSFIYHTWWIGLIPLLIGIVFAIIATVFQFVTIKGITVNDVYTESASAIREFRLIFLLGFGIAGIILQLVGTFYIFFASRQELKNQRLKELGIKVTAKVIDFKASSVRVNHQRLLRLQCTAKINGTDYIFKSQTLRLNPVPFLKNETVDVYYDLGNMKRYFVDIDGSVVDVVEL